MVAQLKTILEMTTSSLEITTPFPNHHFTPFLKQYWQKEKRRFNSIFLHEQWRCSASTLLSLYLCVSVSMWTCAPTCVMSVSLTFHHLINPARHTLTPGLTTRFTGSDLRPSLQHLSLLQSWTFFHSSDHNGKERQTLISDQSRNEKFAPSDQHTYATIQPKTV